MISCSQLAKDENTQPGSCQAVDALCWPSDCVLTFHKSVIQVVHSTLFNPSTNDWLFTVMSYGSAHECSNWSNNTMVCVDVGGNGDVGGRGKGGWGGD